PHAIALFDYQASQKDEISFQAGDVISLEKSVGSDWMIGSLGNRSGLFPVNFVDQPMPEMPAAASALVGPRCRARFDYDGGEEGDLSFNAGDEIGLIERPSEEWLKGQLRGQSGLFPASFVDVIEDLPPPETEAQMFFSSAVDPSLPHCLALHAYASETSGDLCFNEGQLIQLKERVDADWLKGSVDGREGIFPSGFVEIVKDIVNEDLPPRPSSSLGTVTALHDFPGQEASDLAFSAGDSIVVLRRLNASWLFGKIGSREGEFPQDFV
ncbi:hypothetical protein CAPTEDRAFT_37274, partial [Capitella teleta]